MPYERRLSGAPPAPFDTEEQAVAAARHILQANPDAEPEVFDTASGQPCAPGASKAWREELRKEVGF